MGEKNQKILIIGSSDHSLADQCISWHEPLPYLGDYDLIILNLQSISNELLNDNDFGKKLEIMRKEINEIIWANTSVICIADTPKEWGGYYSGKRPVYSNYNWCPIYLYFDIRSGVSFKEDKGGYYKFVSKWTHFLRNWDVAPYVLQKEKYFNPIFDPLLCNNANKFLAFRLYFKENNFSSFDEEVDGVFSNSITFLPPTTKITVKEGIDFLLKQIKKDIIFEEPSSLPDWTNEIKISDEEFFKKEIQKKNKLIKTTQEEVQKLEEELSSLMKYKGLLTEGGEGDAGKRLENIVGDTFKLLGIDIESGPKSKEDKIVTDPKTKERIPVEIGGFVKSVPERKLTQLIGRLTDDRRPKKIKCRGIVVGNHYKDISLNSELNGREKAFEPDVIEKAKAFDVSLLSTLELFRAVDHKLKGNDIAHFTEKIFNNPGIIKFS